MINWINSPYGFFLTLGGLLLIIELLSITGYALWCGIAALLVGVIAWLIPVSWAGLWLIFAVLSLVVVYLWWRYSQQHEHYSSSDLNRPQHSLLGLQTIVIEPIIHGRGRVKVNDSSWMAACEEDLPLGAVVKVIAVHDLVLQVERLNQTNSTVTQSIEQEAE